MTTMASPKPYASVSEELSDVQVLDSDEPLVTASSSAPSSSSARVMDSIEPLVPTTRVQVLDSNEPLVLPCVRSSVLDEPVAGPSGMAGPSGVAGTSGSLSAIASSSEDEDEEYAAMPRPTGSSGRRRNPYSDEIRSMWNWRKISVVSARTVADWFSYCRETIAIYELENQRAQGQIGGPNKHTQRIESQWRGMKTRFRQTQNKHNFTDWLCEYSWRRRIMMEHLDPFEELINAINTVYRVD